MEEQVRAAIIAKLRRLAGDAADLQVRGDGNAPIVQVSINVDCVAMPAVTSTAGDP